MARVPADRVAEPKALPALTGGLPGNSRPGSPPDHQPIPPPRCVSENRADSCDCPVLRLDLARDGWPRKRTGARAQARDAVGQSITPGVVRQQPSQRLTQLERIAWPDEGPCLAVCDVLGES